MGVGGKIVSSIRQIRISHSNRYSPHQRVHSTNWNRTINHLIRIPNPSIKRQLLAGKRSYWKLSESAVSTGEGKDQWRDWSTSSASNQFVRIRTIQAVYGTGPACDILIKSSRTVHASPRGVKRNEQTAARTTLRFSRSDTASAGLITVTVIQLKITNSHVRVTNALRNDLWYDWCVAITDRIVHKENTVIILDTRKRAITGELNSTRWDSLHLTFNKSPSITGRNQVYKNWETLRNGNRSHQDSVELEAQEGVTSGNVDLPSEGISDLSLEYHSGSRCGSTGSFAAQNIVITVVKQGVGRVGL